MDHRGNEGERVAVDVEVLGWIVPDQGRRERQRCGRLDCLCQLRREEFVGLLAVHIPDEDDDVPVRGDSVGKAVELLGHVREPVGFRLPGRVCYGGYVAVLAVVRSVERSQLTLTSSAL